MVVKGMTEVKCKDCGIIYTLEGEMPKIECICHSPKFEINERYEAS